MVTNNEIKYEYESDASNEENSGSEQDEAVKGDVSFEDDCDDCESDADEADEVEQTGEDL